MISKSLAQFLITNQAISAITTEIRPVKLQEGHADPAIVYMQADDRQFPIIAGRSSLKQAEFYIDFYSQSYETVKTLALAVRTALDNYMGAFGDHIAENIECTTDDDMFEDQTKYYRVAQNYVIWYSDN